MRIGIVVDSCCDLPQSFIQQEHIDILPISVRINDVTQVDYRDEDATLGFLQSHIAEQGVNAVTIPFTVEQIRDLFLTKLVIDYDYVYCLTLMRSRSPIFENAQQASFAILNEYKAIRTGAGINTPFALRVIDTQSLFAAQGILPIEAARLRAAGEGPAKIRARLEHLALHTHGHLVPRDLYYIRNRARMKGDRSIGLIGAMLGTALDIKPIIRSYRGHTGPVAKVRGYDAGARKILELAARNVDGGLMTPAINLSYGGELEEMRQLPGYSQLREACGSHDVTLYESMMSLTGLVNVGKGALGVGFASEREQKVD